MYSLLIKDRSYPISVYMAYMMRVKGFTRSQAVEMMTMAAVKMGLRESETVPANNTVAEWGKSIEAPLWSIVTVMTILEQFGKIPFIDQEWAFWAYAAVERGADKSKYSGKWQQWLDKAQLYKIEFDKRGQVRKELEALTSPQTAMKVLLAFRGNSVSSLSMAEIFSNIDNSTSTVVRLAKKLSVGESFDKNDLRETLEENDMARSTYADISHIIQELVAIGLLHHLSNGNIAIA